MLSLRLPYTWVLARLSDICVGIKRVNPSSQGDGYFQYVDISSIDNERKEITSTSEIPNRKAPSRARQIINRNDILVSTVRPNLNAVAIVPEQLNEAICSTGFCVLRPNANLVIPEYIFAWVRTPQFITLMTRLARGIGYPAVSDKDIFGSPIPLPSLKEQQLIISILNRTDALRCQWREALEQEKKLSADLFLKMFGDPDPRINRRWEVVTLGEITQVETGGTPSRTNLEFYKGEVPWVKSTELVDEKIYQTEEAISDAALEKSNTKKFPIGTILLAMYGQGQTRGRTGLLEITATCNQACAGILPNDKLLPSYIFVWLQCSYERIRALGRGGQQPNLNLSIVRSLQIPKPPIIIQRRFCETLSLLEEIQNESNSVTEQYEELLAQIISDAFSGKLTQKWREAHQQEMEIWFREHTENLPRKSAHVSDQEVAPPERFAPTQSTRRWVMGQLSNIQNQVYTILAQWQSVFIPSEDLDRFLEEWLVEPVEDSYVEDTHDHVLRALNQMAGLGLIARVSIPSQTGEYLTGYRILREEELTKTSDLDRLRALS